VAALTNSERTQQRFRQAHQRHALLAGERVFMHQPFDAGPLVLGPERLDQLSCCVSRCFPGVIGKGCSFDEARHANRLWRAIGGGDGAAEIALLPDRRSKSIEGICMAICLL
jgi:hypothetical protein